MGISKEKLIQMDDYRAIAKDILNELGVIETCDICEYYTHIRDLEDADYARATNMLKERNLLSIDFKMFHNVLKSVVDESTFGSIANHIEKAHINND